MTDYARLCGSEVHRLVRHLEKPTKDGRRFYLRTLAGVQRAWFWRWHKALERHAQCLITPRDESATAYGYGHEDRLAELRRREIPGERIPRRDRAPSVPSPRRPPADVLHLAVPRTARTKAGRLPLVPLAERKGVSRVPRRRCFPAAVRVHRPRGPYTREQRGSRFPQERGVAVPVVRLLRPLLPTGSVPRCCA